MKEKIVAGLATGVFLLGTAGMAQALAVSDMQLNQVDADAVVLVPGNDSAGILNDQGGLFAGDEFSFIAKTEEDTGGVGLGSLGGILFSISANGEKSGTWDFTWSGATPPVNIDFVSVLKGSDNFAAFLFDDELLASSAGTNNPDDIWQITFLNNGGQIPDLSHLSLYGREGGENGENGENGGNGGNGDLAPIPEPATMLLLGTGLAGLAGARRKKKT